MVFYYLGSLLENPSVKLYPQTLDMAKDIQRDPRFPFENDSIFYSYSTFKVNELWKEMVKKQDSKTFINYYHETRSILDKLVSSGMANKELRGLRYIEKIKESSR